MKILYILYQYLIGLPLIILVTLFTAVFTIVCFPWKNGKAPRAVQVFWSRSVLWLLLVPIKVTGAENVNPKPKKKIKKYIDLYLLLEKKNE